MIACRSASTAPFVSPVVLSRMARSWWKGGEFGSHSMALRIWRMAAALSPRSIANWLSCMRPVGWSALRSSMLTSSRPARELRSSVSQSAHAAATRTDLTGSSSNGWRSLRTLVLFPRIVLPSVRTAASRTNGLGWEIWWSNAWIAAGSNDHLSSRWQALAFHAGVSSLARSLINPSRAAESPRRALAINRARVREGRSGFSPKKFLLAAMAQSASLSVWQRLQALGTPSSFVSLGSGMLKLWSCRGWRCM